jgi:AcrR family transcriptional regulator
VPTPEPSQTRYDDLVDVATKLFSEHGYERTTVRMIAEEMGVQSGSLYSHIASKEEVLRRIVLACAEGILVRVSEALADHESPEDQLRAMARAHLEMLEERQAAVTIYFDEWHKLDDESRAHIAGLRRSYEKLVTGVIEAGVEQGTFGNVDVRGAVLVILSALNWAYKWYSPKGAMSPDQIADVFVSTLLDGLRRRPDAAAPAGAANGAKSSSTKPRSRKR